LAWLGNLFPNPSVGVMTFARFARGCFRTLVRWVVGINALLGFLKTPLAWTLAKLVSNRPRH
jgi:hypothetical protein